MLHSIQRDNNFVYSTLRQRALLVVRSWLILIMVISTFTGCDLSQPPSAVPPAQPSPITAPAPYPTMEPKRWLGGSDPQATFQLPGVTFDVRAAVSPTDVPLVPTIVTDPG